MLKFLKNLKSSRALFFFREPSRKEIIKTLTRKIKYPKLILLVLSVFIGYLVYKDGNDFHFHQTLIRMGYLGTFFAGFFFVYGFTTAISIASLLILSPLQNFWLAVSIAMLGSIISNLFLFRFMRISVTGELDYLSKNKLLKIILKELEKYTPLFVRKYILPAFAGFIAASPLPDELAVAMVSWSKDISIATFSAVAFSMNVFGIFLIIWLGRMI
jgi:hypothetical protein